MSKAKEEGLFRGRRTHDLVAVCLQIAHGTVTTVMNAYRADNDPKFEPMPSHRGKKREYDPEELKPVIQTFIDTQNRLGQPVTAQKIILEKKYHILADSAAVVSLREYYIEKKAR
ncbi:hypothetical protein F441_22932 [Phytophthora nicotianae CJ01A1]|uniref:Uncharacterized protein n=1 Tax=Phytophthora nicotianae CJ01A1 TaxID=1317063 RepID=W2VPQ6_PHYNI|nr:hypothetical protein F441_22932 [Phytophthora nicotianae CJ01A1]